MKPIIANTSLTTGTDTSPTLAVPDYAGGAYIVFRVTAASPTPSINLDVYGVITLTNGTSANIHLHSAAAQAVATGNHYTYQIGRGDIANQSATTMIATAEMLLPQQLVITNTFSGTGSINYTVHIIWCA